MHELKNLFQTLVPHDFVWFSGVSDAEDLSISFMSMNNVEKYDVTPSDRESHN